MPGCDTATKSEAGVKPRGRSSLVRQLRLGERVPPLCVKIEGIVVECDKRRKDWTTKDDDGQISEGSNMRALQSTWLTGGHLLDHALTADDQ